MCAPTTRKESRAFQVALRFVLFNTVALSLLVFGLPYIFTGVGVVLSPFEWLGAWLGLKLPRFVTSIPAAALGLLTWSVLTVCAYELVARLLCISNVYRGFDPGSFASRFDFAATDARVMTPPEKPNVETD